MALKKKIIAGILVFLLIINSVILAFVFIDIQVLTFPKTTLRLDVIEINADEILLHHTLQIYNPNSFEMILKNFQIVATTPSGDEVTNITIDGDSVPGKSHRNFTASDIIVMRGNLSDLLSCTVTGVIGINFFGIIKKTIPLELTMLISMKEALKKIALPGIAVHAEFGTITRQAVNLNTEIEVSNSNPFDIVVDRFIINITNETGGSLGHFMIPGSPIPAESTVTLRGNGSVIIQALNAKKLLISLQAQAGMTLAGITKSLPFSSEIELAIPNLNEFIPADKYLELSLNIDLQRARGGLNGNMTLEVINPTKIPFIASDLRVLYYRVKKNQKYFVAEGWFGSGELVPESTTIFYGDMLLPYSKLFFQGGGVLPDMVFAQLRTNLSLSGVNLFIPVAIGSYIDFQPFRHS